MEKIQQYSNITLDEEKYKNAILYFVKYCNNEHLGSTKLNKLLYYFDFVSYRDRQIIVTGDRYIHNQFGPTPASTALVLSDLKKEGSLDMKTVTREEGREGVGYKLRKDPDLSVFDAYEQKLLRSICKELALWTTPKIVEQTHLEAPWFYSKLFEEVDYEYAKDIDIIPTP